MNDNALWRCNRSDLKIIKYVHPDIYKFLFKLGLLPNRYEEIVHLFNTYSEYMELENCSKTEAVEFCSKYFHAPSHTIWNIVSELE